VLSDANPRLLSAGKRFHATYREIINKLAVRDREIARRDAEHAALTAQNQALQADRAAWQEHVSVRDREVGRRDHAIALLEEERARLAARMQALQSHCNALQIKNDELLASSSWRLTKPVRVIGAVLRWTRLR
jgi:uncharacterized protein (DUF3084 family)